MEHTTKQAINRIDTNQIGVFADNLATSLQRQMKNMWKPEENKTLRRFSSKEVSDMLRVSPSNLRTRHKDGSFPDVQTDIRGHRFYTAEDVDQLRTIMVETGKVPENYQTGRRKDDNHYQPCPTPYIGFGRSRGRL